MVQPGPFHEYEKERGARFEERGGRLVAVAYGPGTGGVEAARTAVALADLTCWTRLEVIGADRVRLLQRISTNDLVPLAEGRLRTTIFVTPKGRILDRAMILDLGDRLMIVAAAGGRQRLAAWIRRYTLASDVQVRDVTEETSAFGLVGPAAGRHLQALTGQPAPGEGEARLVLFPSPWQGALAAPLAALPSTWIVMGSPDVIRDLHLRARGEAGPGAPPPVGSDELEVLRVEAGIPAEGRELTEDWNPREAALDADLSDDKGCYTGQEVIARLKTYEKVQRRLAGIRLGSAEPIAVPAPLYGVGESGGEIAIGTLTSAVRSERAGETIGLGYVGLSHHRPGAALSVGAQRRPGSVASLPFFPPAVS